MVRTEVVCARVRRASWARLRRRARADRHALLHQLVRPRSDAERRWVSCPPTPVSGRSGSGRGHWAPTGLLRTGDRAPRGHLEKPSPPSAREQPARRARLGARRARRVPPRTTGLFHLALLVPTRADLAAALRRVFDAGLAPERRVRPPRQRGALPLTTPRATGSSCIATGPARSGRTPRGELADGDAPARPRGPARGARGGGRRTRGDAGGRARPRPPPGRGPRGRRRSSRWARLRRRPCAATPARSSSRPAATTTTSGSTRGPGSAPRRRPTGARGLDRFEIVVPDKPSLSAVREGLVRGRTRQCGRPPAHRRRSLGKRRPDPSRLAAADRSGQLGLRHLRPALDVPGLRLLVELVARSGRGVLSGSRAARRDGPRRCPRGRGATPSATRRAAHAPC